MNSEQLFHDIQNNPVSVLIGKQSHALGAVAELFHIAGLILLLASIVLMSLRLLGLGLRKQSLPQLAAATSRLIWIGLAFLVVSGLILFLPAADLYYPNPVFWFKFKVFAVALIVQVTLYRTVTRLESPKPIVAKATAVTVLGLWFAVAFSGRFIGFF